MNSAAASITAPYPLTERRAINPWIIAVTVTLATFMELLDTAIAKSPYATSQAVSPPAMMKAPGSSQVT